MKKTTSKKKPPAEAVVINRFSRIFKALAIWFNSALCKILTNAIYIWQRNS